jgi:hypothetical protein
VFILAGCKRGKLSAKLCPCGQLDCLSCAEGPDYKAGEKPEGSGVVGRRRAGRLFERMGRPDLARVVVTWPDAAAISGEGAVLLRQDMQLAIEGWFCEVWGVDAMGVHSYAHPCGDKDPRTSRPHVHFQVPLWGAQMTENGGRVRAMGALAPHVDPRHLDRLRAYAQAVQEAHGIEGPPQAWYEYEQSPTDKLHALRYDGRTFPRWYAGDLPRSLRIGRSTGLLAPNRKALGLDHWRAAIRGTAPELAPVDDPIERVRAGIECYCGCGAELVVLDCGPARGWHGVIVDAWGRAPGSAALAEVRRLYGRGPPGGTMHDHQASRVDTRTSKQNIPY